MACYILAVIQENNSLFIFDASSLRKWTIKENTNPLTKNKIDQIFYFVMQQPNDKTFEYLCDIKNEKINFLNDFLNSEVKISTRFNALGLLLDKLKKYSKLELECYSKAIENDKDNPTFLGNFALTYEQAQGNEVDQEKAFGYFKLAADKGNPSSLKQLGVRYKEGKGVKKNLALAIYYLHQAVKKDVAGVIAILDEAIEETKNLEEKRMLKSKEETLNKTSLKRKVEANKHKNSKI